jgi:hypothetical protein
MGIMILQKSVHQISERPFVFFFFFFCVCHSYLSCHLVQL